LLLLILFNGYHRVSVDRNDIDGYCKLDNQSLQLISATLTPKPKQF